MLRPDITDMKARLCRAGAWLTIYLLLAIPLSGLVCVVASLFAGPMGLMFGIMAAFAAGKLMIAGLTIGGPAALIAAMFASGPNNVLMACLGALAGAMLYLSGASLAHYPEIPFMILAPVFGGFAAGWIANRALGDATPVPESPGPKAAGMAMVGFVIVACVALYAWLNVAREPRFNLTFDLEIEGKPTSATTAFHCPAKRRSRTSIENQVETSRDFNRAQASFALNDGKAVVLQFPYPCRESSLTGDRFRSKVRALLLDNATEPTSITQDPSRIAIKDISTSGATPEDRMVALASEPGSIRWMRGHDEIDAGDVPAYGYFELTARRMTEESWRRTKAADVLAPLDRPAFFPWITLGLGNLVGNRATETDPETYYFDRATHAWQTTPAAIPMRKLETAGDADTFVKDELPGILGEMAGGAYEAGGRTLVHEPRIVFFDPADRSIYIIDMQPMAYIPARLHEGLRDRP